MPLPAAEFPLFDGLSSNRPDTDVIRKPDGIDWNQAIAEILALQGMTGFTVSAVAAAGAANVTEVTVTVKDARNAAVTVPVVFDLFLSDSASGVGLTATTASGAVDAKAASGAVVGILTTKKYLKVQTLANGTFVLSITDTAKTLFKVCAVNPVNGKTSVLLTLITGNYG